MCKSLYQKLYDSHLVYERNDEIPLLYIDRHLIHEVTSPQAFDSIKSKGYSVRCPSKIFATMDHNVSTILSDINAANKFGRIQLKKLIENCNEFGITLYGLGHSKQGIVHVIGPEQGITLPGMTIVCGDSHTSTHGAFGALAFGIGTSDIEHALVTQTIRQERAKTMQIEVSGKINSWITPKDIILFIIGKVGVNGGTGYVVEFCGEVISNLSMEGRMTLCNMVIEMGAKSGLIAPDIVTYQYLHDKEFAPKDKIWNEAMSYWNTLKSDVGFCFDKMVHIDISNVSPQITWGTNPSQVIAINESIPMLESCISLVERNSAIKALNYMDLRPGMSLIGTQVHKVFIGSCTNSRIEDLRIASNVVLGHKVAKDVHAIVVPGSYPVKFQAEKEGLDKIFIDAGFEWRLPGCSMCLAMNNDRLSFGERCASTSNRNFESRQGYGGRTHLLSPVMAAAAAIAGCFVDVREIC